MFCLYCGLKLDGNPKVCPSCKKNLSGINQQSYQDSPMQFNYSSNKDEHENHQTSYFSDSYHDKKQKQVPTSLYIALGIVSFLFVAFMVILFLIPKTGINGDNSTFTLTCNDVPAQTGDESYTISGTITSDENSANLMVNGQLVDCINPSKQPKVWSYTLPLNLGENKIVVTLTNNLGLSESQILTIDRTMPLKYEKGTMLAKSNKSGVYVRPTPAVTDKYIILIPKTDYTSQYECIGEECTDIDGYLWAKVKTPTNGIGWIRTDLMKVVSD